MEHRSSWPDKSPLELKREVASLHGTEGIKRCINEYAASQGEQMRYNLNLECIGVNLARTTWMFKAHVMHTKQMVFKLERRCSENDRDPKCACAGVEVEALGAQCIW